MAVTLPLKEKAQPHRVKGLNRDKCNGEKVAG